MELKDKQILILGEGISGKGAFGALEGVAARFFYYEGCLDKTAPDIIVTSPGIATHPAFDYAAKNNVPVISELELGYILNRSPVVGITGTNGKTTVTRLIGDMAETEYKTVVCGNIGVAFSAAARLPHKLAVVEVSSFQLLNCYELRPDIAVITNISPDHLDRHGNMENYIQAKLRITRNQTAENFLICPVSLRPFVKDVRAQILYSGLDCRQDGGVIYFLNEAVMDCRDLPLAGEHNLSNVLQAVCASKLLGVSNESIRDTVTNFKPEPHRLQLISGALGKKWYDDSKATNIDACLAACRSMSGDTALILGGSDKGYDYDELFLKLPNSIKHVYIMGAVKDKLRAAADRTGRAVIETANMLEAVTLASDLNVQNILLSPAAASFDNFQNYAQRGRAFYDAVLYVERAKIE